jgi:hypothetical protein
VWYRLVCQATLGLRTAHEAGLIHGNLNAADVVLTPDGTLKLCGFGQPDWLSPTESPYSQDEQGDLQALSALVRGWAEPMAQRKGGKGRAVPESVVRFLRRLGSKDSKNTFESAAAMSEELEGLGEDVPPNAVAWKRLLQHVRDHGAEEPRLRQSA